MSCYRRWSALAALGCLGVQSCWAQEWSEPDIIARFQSLSPQAREFRARVDRFIEAEGLTAPLDATPCADADLIPEISDPLSELDLDAAGVRSIIWATGFRVAYDWIDLDVFDSSGEPIHRGGISAHPGLHFLGLRWLTKYKSFFIYGVGEDATRLAAHISSR